MADQEKNTEQEFVTEFEVDPEMLEALRIQWNEDLNRLKASRADFQKALDRLKKANLYRREVRQLWATTSQLIKDTNTEIAVLEDKIENATVEESSN